MKQIIAKVRSLVFSRDPVPLEVQIIYINIMSGLWISSPFKGSSPVTSYILNQIAPKNYLFVLGAIVLAIGIAQLIALMANNIKLRRAIYFLSVGVWASLTFTFIGYNTYGLSSVLFSTILLTNMWLYIRLGMD